MHVSKSKSRKCEILAVSWTPADKKLKKHQFAQGKSVCKGLQICTYRFLGMPITMHYVRTLCDKYFLSYYGFSAFFMGRSRYRVLKHGVGVKWDPRRTAAYVHPIFMVLNLIFYYVSLKIVIFHEPLIIETDKCLWIRHASNPKFWSIFASQNEQNVKFLPEIVIFRNRLLQRLETCSIGFGMPQTLNMHHSSHFDAFFPVKIKKMWNVGFFLNSPWQKTEKQHQFVQGKSVCKGLQICT